MSKSRRTRPRPAQIPAPSNTFLARDIEIVATETLRAYARDLRSHSDKQVAQIGASIRAFGFIVPIVVAADGVIVAGHGRWLAARELGLSQIPIIRAGHLSPERLRAFRLADNRLADNAGWNREALALELSELTDLVLDFELELTGFETAEIDLIIDGPAESKASPDDACPALVPAAVTRPGDLSRLGRHRLVCGSALEAESYQRLLGDHQVRMAFSDPPTTCRSPAMSAGRGA